MRSNQLRNDSKTSISKNSKLQTAQDKEIVNPIFKVKRKAPFNEPYKPKSSEQLKILKKEFKKDPCWSPEKMK